MQFPVIRDQSRRRRDAIASVIALILTIVATGAAAVGSFFIGINTAGCTIGDNCNSFLVIIGWLGGLLIPPLVAVAGIIFSFRLIYTRRRSSQLAWLTLVVVVITWVLLALVTQVGMPGFSLLDLLPR